MCLKWINAIKQAGSVNKSNSDSSSDVSVSSSVHSSPDAANTRKASGKSWSMLSKLKVI